MGSEPSESLNWPYITHLESCPSRHSPTDSSDEPEIENGSDEGGWVQSMVAKEPKWKFWLRSATIFVKRAAIMLPSDQRRVASLSLEERTEKPPMTKAVVIFCFLAPALPNLFAQSAAPLLPGNGVVNAADGAAAIAPGDWLSLYGTNLADGLHQAQSLPLPTTLNGVTVEVQAGGQSYAAPLTFVSPGQINCQLPYEATTQVQIRVRNAAGITAWVPLTVVASAPRFLTWSQTGAGPVAATTSSYKIVDAKNPAKPGDYVVAYLIGLGQTSPAATTGKAAPDGVSGPLETVGNVFVSIAGQTVNTAFAGLSPGSVGLYQVNFQVPSNVVAGDYPIQIIAGTAKGQTVATLPAGAAPITLYNNFNPNACSLTSTSSVTLANDAYVSRLQVWYQWAQNETGVNYTVSSASKTVAQGTMTRSSCDPLQSSWCGADAPVFASWPAATYTVTLSKAQMCQNAQSSGTGFVNLTGVWSTAGWQPAAGGQIGPSGGTVSGGGFSLTAPAGAFSSPATFSITQSTQPIATQTSAVTGLYQFQGMPDAIGQPITVSLDVKATGATDGEAFLVMSVDDDPRSPVLMLPAKIANGKLTATLPAVAGPPAAQSGSSPAQASDKRPATVPQDAAPPAPVTSGRGTLLGVARFVSVASKSGKYAVHYQRDFPENMDYADTVAALLDEADPKVAATGIEVAKRSHIDCHIYSFNYFGPIFKIKKNAQGEYLAGFADSEIWGADQIGLNVNTDLLGQPRSVTEVRTTTAHELYHVYQALYDPRGSNVRKSIQSSPWLWFLEASAEWFMNSMANDPTFVSDLAVANLDYFLVRGLDFVPSGLALSWPPLSEEVQNHGYGAATFLEYAAPVGGANQTEIGKTIQLMAQTTGLIFKNYTWSPLDAWMQQNVFLRDRWLGYLETYAGGKLNRFSNNPSFTTSGLVAGTLHAQSYSFNSDSDSGTTFNWTAPDMSGALAVVNFKNTSTKWAPGSQLNLTLPVTNSYLEGIVYRRTGGSVQFVATFKDSMVFQNAEQMAARGDTLYVLLANGNADRPFAKAHSFQLVVQLTTTQLPAYKWLRWSLGPAGSPWDTGGNFLLDLNQSCALQWKLNTFTSSCQYTTNGSMPSIYTTYMTGSVDPVKKTISFQNLYGHSGGYTCTVNVTNRCCPAIRGTESTGCRRRVNRTRCRTLEVPVKSAFSRKA
jgi:uncharacterized protein (TIGR03437 family)